MAGLCPLRRQPRLPDRQLPHPVALAGLGHSCAERQHAVRSIHDRATRRRPASQPDALAESGDRVSPQSPHQRRGRHHRRRMADREYHRPRGHDRSDVDGLNVGLRPLSRPQVRPDHTEGVLQPVCLLQQYRRDRRDPRRLEPHRRQSRPLDQGAGCGAAEDARRIDGRRDPGGSGRQGSGENPARTVGCLGTQIQKGSRREQTTVGTPDAGDGPFHRRRHLQSRRRRNLSRRRSDASQGHLRH